ncbi:MAG: VCBS domain-containing protein, partial [Gallionella sp.]|nr:VCBS domain-containing protein [Gallionella sp.]
MASTQDMVGKIVIASGAVFIQRDGKIIPASTGTELRQGDLVTTGANGKAGLAMVDQTRFSLGEKASMKLDQVTFNPAEKPESEKSGSMTVSVIKGAFMFITGQIAHLSGETTRMKVRTASATIGIRGTQVAGDVHTDGTESTFSLLPNPDGAKSFAQIENAGGTTTLNQPNQSVHVGSYFTPPSEPFQATPAQILQTYGQVFPIMAQVSKEMGLPGPVNQQTYQLPPAPAGEKSGDDAPKEGKGKGKGSGEMELDQDSRDNEQTDKTTGEPGEFDAANAIAIQQQVAELNAIRNASVADILANPSLYSFAPTTVVQNIGGQQVTFYAPSFAALVTNIPPSAVADQAALNETALAPVTGSVLTNDIDPDGQPLPLEVLAYTSVNTPGAPGSAGSMIAGQFGSLSIAADGSYSYILDSGKAQAYNFAGAASVADVFSYSITDGASSGNSTVSFTIQDMNAGFLANAFSSALITVSTDSFTAATGDILSAATVVAGAYDAAVVVTGFNKDGGGSVTAGNAVTGLYGTLLLNPSGTYEYTLDPTKVAALAVGSVVTDNFAYTLSTGQVSNFTVAVDAVGTSVTGIELVKFTYYYGNITPDTDYYTGYTFAAVDRFNTGDTFTTLMTEAALNSGLTSPGYYVIDNVIANQSGVIDLVRVTSYYDANTLQAFATPYVKGLAGIGSEKGAVAAAGDGVGVPATTWVYDYANYFFEANIDNTTTATNIQYYTYTYDYGTGDFYTGYGYTTAGKYAAGDVVDVSGINGAGTGIAGLPGSYYIENVFTIQDSATDNISAGQVYVTSYYDANGVLSNTTANASGTVGLGSERGNVFSTTTAGADAFDAFTSATIPVTVQTATPQLYYFHYNYGDTDLGTAGYQGDVYFGYGYAAADTYTVSATAVSTLTNELGLTGSYYIDATYTSDIGQVGEVFVSYYFDGKIDTTATDGAGWNTTIVGSGTTGLGSESGTVYNSLVGNTADTFSNYYSADVAAAGASTMQMYYFHYDYGNGIDTYYGYGYNDSNLTGVIYGFGGGEVSTIANVATEAGATGAYTIDSVFSTTFGISGEVNVTSYYDSNGAGWNTYVNGVGQHGLGSEEGSVSNYSGSNAGVFSSYNAADVSGSSLQLYYFHYDYGNGDTYYGYGYADTGIYTASATAAKTVTNELGLTGNYYIDSVYTTDYGVSGEVYVENYNDADGAGWDTSISGFGQNGLGSEKGTVYNYEGAADSFSSYNEADVPTSGAGAGFQLYYFTYQYGGASSDYYYGYGYADGAADLAALVNTANAATGANG